MKISKLNAFSIHFGLSLFIFLVLVAMMYFVWFPGDYFMLDGGWQGLRLIAAIDLILGPALTLLLFKPGKPRLLMDMTIIAVLQIGALSYGLFATYQQRTMGLVFAESTFSTISYRDLQLANAQITQRNLIPVNLDKLDGSYPKQIYTETLDASNFGTYLAGVLNGMPGLNERTDKYHSLADYAQELSQYKLAQSDISQTNTLNKIKSVLSNENKTVSDVHMYRFKARYGDGIALFDLDQKKVTHLVAVEKASL
jgi:hypothetical protein